MLNSVSQDPKLAIESSTVSDCVLHMSTLQEWAIHSLGICSVNHSPAAQYLCIPFMLSDKLTSTDPNHFVVITDFQRIGLHVVRYRNHFRSNKCLFMCLWT